MICTSGNGPGLIDHNAFTAGCASEIIHNLGGGGWSDDVVPGSLNMLFIEDNTFTNAGGGCVVQAEEGYTNSRGVFRHNTLFGVANDVHGGTNGGRWWEFYENIYNLGNLGSLPNFIQFRGGSGLITIITMSLLVQPRSWDLIVLAATYVAARGWCNTRWVRG